MNSDSLRRSLTLLLFLTVLTVGVARPGYCWDKMAHMIISQIAYDRLTPAAKAKVNALAVLMNNDPYTLELEDKYKPYQFVSISAWPDDIRSLKDETKSFGPWHYIDLDSLPADDAAAIAAVKAFPAGDTSNVYDAIVNKCLPVLRDPNAKPTDQARMLAFLTHFVGDIHMPLHCLGKDKGGNGVGLDALPSYDPKFPIKNLHGYWDSAYRFDAEDGELLANTDSDTPRPAAPDTGEIKAMADAIVAKSLTTDPALLSQADPAAWAVESNRIAVSSVFLDGNPRVLPADYVRASRATALKRIALAGYRLANLLNSIYAAPAK